MALLDSNMKIIDTIRTRIKFETSDGFTSTGSPTAYHHEYFAGHHHIIGTGGLRYYVVQRILEEKGKLALEDFTVHCFEIKDVSICI